VTSIELSYHPHSSKRPYIVVRLITERATVPFVMLLDSGADTSLIPWGLGRKLGFEESPGEAIRSVSGVGGHIDARERTARVRLAPAEEPLEIKVLWASLETPALLGRAGIFDRFRVEFHQMAGLIRLRGN
jgi:hypothetical protein